MGRTDGLYFILKKEKNEVMKNSHGRPHIMVSSVTLLSNGRDIEISKMLQETRP